MDINAGTSLFCVIGDPISHSLSPVMHNSAFAHIGYNGVYLAFNVKQVSSAIAGIKGLGIKGVSVTIPHKLTVMEFLDEIDESAVKIGAVNTIVNRQGKLYGSNTDYLGATNALLEKTSIKDKNVIMIGAGGAARAIGYGILSEGGRLKIVNILEDEGKQLARDLDVEYYPLQDYKDYNCQILINATPIGMSPNIDEMPIKKEYLQKDMVVMDVVYNPLKTRLLKEAEDIGCITIGGVSMFVYQGVAQFELWTGKKAPVDVMRKTVLDALDIYDRN
ncbi:MAG: shikimate dehydrogenase [Proteobacteria bacterium]|nr:shikimate dehydrogenase [Desulfobacteraceae bacterium]MBU4012284.1 shikimate dehydrogenase [Pseudomonadota bacterium]MBU4067062.1 shikimate dehydrogenase [Pseudomonadota bacterium]MBU4126265.1 shikimate dehydrogenase [Pseudomonadota bacterium]